MQTILTLAVKYRPESTASQYSSSNNNSEPNKNVDLSKPKLDYIKKFVIDYGTKEKSTVENTDKNRSTWIEEAPSKGKKLKDLYEVLCRKRMKSKPLKKNQLLTVGMLNVYPETINLDYIQKHPVFTAEDPITNRLEVFTYAISDEGLTTVSGTPSEGYTTHLDQVKIDGRFNPLIINSHSRMVTDDSSTRVLSPIPVTKIAANDFHGDLVPSKKIEGQFAMIAVPLKEV